MFRTICRVRQGPGGEDHLTGVSLNILLRRYILNQISDILINMRRICIHAQFVCCQLLSLI